MVLTASLYDIRYIMFDIRYVSSLHISDYGVKCPVQFGSLIKCNCTPKSSDLKWSPIKAPSLFKGKKEIQE